MPAMNKTQRDHLLKRMRAAVDLKVGELNTAAYAVEPATLSEERSVTAKELIKGIMSGAVVAYPGRESSDGYTLLRALVRVEHKPAAIKANALANQRDKLKEAAAVEIARIEDDLIFTNVGDVQRILSDFHKKLGL